MPLFGGALGLDALRSDSAANERGPAPRKRALPPVFRHLKFLRAGSGRPFLRGYHWAFAALGLVLLAEIVAAAIVGVLVFDASPLKLFVVDDFRKTLPGWLLLPLIWIGLVTFQLVRRQIDHPTRVILRLIRYRSDWLLRGLLILACYPAMAKSFTVLKSAIPAINVYYLDPALVDFDVWLLGDDAWRLSYALMPSWFLVAIDRVYILWFTYVVILTGVFSFTRDTRFQIRGALTFHFCWFLIGICLATGLASVGPVFYDMTYGGDRFAELLGILRNTHEERGLVAVYAMEFLVKNAGTTKLGVGISAMPSVHVTFAFFGFLLALQFPGKMWLKVFTAAFTIATLLGSVHLGWHYLSDGFVGMILVYLIWIGVGRFVDAVYREPARVVGGPVPIRHVHPLGQQQIG